MIMEFTNSPVRILLLNSRDGFEYIDTPQPNFSSVLVKNDKYYKDQLLFEIIEQDDRYTHMAIHKDHLNHKNISIRISGWPEDPAIMIVHQELDKSLMTYIDTNFGINIKFKWEYIDYFRNKYIEGVKKFLNDNRYEDKNKWYPILTKKLTSTERLYLDLEI